LASMVGPGASELEMPFSLQRDLDPVAALQPH